MVDTRTATEMKQINDSKSSNEIVIQLMQQLNKTTHPLNNKQLSRDE